MTPVQLLGDDARQYADQGFAVNQLGASYSIGLDGYSLRPDPLLLGSAHDRHLTMRTAAR